MRPIKLKISGLNSYIETQTIDFSKLTERGLFGIFGPTGCGKSTILDAMILSLYGHKGQKGIPRSTNEFINTAAEHASIGLLFALETEEGPRKINVERKFKRTDTGISTNFSRLQLLTMDDEVLEVWDKTTDVTNQVVEILGLTREDFMRSVVLPQGKFSEFLTLEGKERRDMLERLLDLKAFGSTLQRKIKDRSDKQKNRMLQLEGEMKRFSDITPEVLEGLKISYEDAQKYENELKEAFQLLEQEKNKINRLYEIVKSLEEHKLKERKLNFQLDEQLAEKNKLRLANEASKIWPIHLQLINSKVEFEKTSKSLDNTEASYKNKQEEFNDTKEKFEVFETQFNLKKEQLTIKLNEIESARQHDHNAKELNKERNERIKEYKAFQLSVSTLKEELATLTEKISARTQRLETLEQDKKKNQVSSEDRESVLEGVQLENEIEAKKEKVLGIELQIEKLSKRLASDKSGFEDRKGVAEKLENKLKDQSKKIEELNQLIGEAPTEINKLQAEVSDLKLTQGLLTNKLKEKNIIEKKCRDVKDKIKVNKTLENEGLIQLKKAKQALNEAESMRLTYWTGVVLDTLGRDLGDTDNCPLCGSDHHPKMYVSKPLDKSIEGKSETTWAEKEQVWRDAKLKNDQIANQLEHEKSVLGDLLKNLEAYMDADQSQLDALNFKLLSLDGSINEIKKDYQSNQEIFKLKNTELDTLKESIELMQNELKTKELGMIKSETQLESDQNILNQLKMELKTLTSKQALTKHEKSFKKLYEEIQVKDKALKVCEQSITDERKNLTQEQKTIDSLSTRKHQAQVQMEKTIEKGSGLKDRIDAHYAEVKKVVGEEEIEVHFQNQKAQLDNLLKEHIEIKTKMEELQKALSSLANAYEGEKGQLEQLTHTKSQLEDKIEQYYASSEINTESMLVVCHVEEKELKNRQERVNKYFEDKTILSDRINELEKERGERSLTEASYSEFIDNHKTTKEKLNGAIESRTMLSERLKALEKDSEQLEILSGQYKRFEQIQDLVSDLLDLIRGNKFVEYVAITHLKYIALDASKRLMDITNHRYSLELDSKGNFIICDHYNGGVKRDTKTLSGGETFLTALSLSLALSSQIQLKGRTNLEFFFLDEGFGTLDNELLDIVMTSLEKLFHEKLTVGIISHVDELKNRVPIKLTVEPAQAGVHGTKTKIEVT